MVNWCGTFDLSLNLIFLSLIIYTPVSPQDSISTNPSSLHPASCPHRMPQSPTLSRGPASPVLSLGWRNHVRCCWGHSAGAQRASTSSHGGQGACAPRRTCGGRRSGWTTSMRSRATLRATRTRRARPSCRSCIPARTASSASLASSISTALPKRASTTWMCRPCSGLRSWLCGAVSGPRNELIVADLGVAASAILWVE